MGNYELTVIVSSGTSVKQKAALKKVQKVVRDVGGKTDKTNEIGERDLAYPINKQEKGVYYFLTVDLPYDKVSEIKRELELDEEILRYLLVTK